MTDSDLAEQLNALSEAELLEAINRTLAKRQRPPTEEQLAARDADAEYERFYPTGGAR